MKIELEYPYKDLYKYVCNIYNYLLKNNPNRKSVIVYGHKDIYMIASFLACSFAGMAYIPVDESIPNERRKKIVEQVKPNVILDKKIEKTMLNEKYNEIFDRIAAQYTDEQLKVISNFLPSDVKQYLSFNNEKYKSLGVNTQVVETQVQNDNKKIMSKIFVILIGIVLIVFSNFWVQ